MSFLIVDDNCAMRRTIRFVISEFADRIIECDDGAKAFAAYEKHHPDWVLMDVEMREKDGLTATRDICDEFLAAKIVIVTVRDDATMRAAAKKSGACGFVGKENLLQLREILRSEILRNYR